MSSNIEWTDETWNPTSGCTKISPGCAHCYIERTPPMRMAGRKFVKGKIPLQLHEDRLDAPLHWKKPRRVFVNSMSDLFHEDVPDEFIRQVFATMDQAGKHTFQILTKRAERMQKFMTEYTNDYLAWQSPDGEAGATPLHNVWLGVSCEDQQRADERIPLLSQTPAVARFLSCEPLLGGIDLRLERVTRNGNGERVTVTGHNGAHLPGIDWVIVGGESGPGARPCNISWIRSIVAQCKAAGVACFVKQLGSSPTMDKSDYGVHVGALRTVDKKGGNPAEWPADMRVREWPNERKELAS